MMCRLISVMLSATSDVSHRANSRGLDVPDSGVDCDASSADAKAAAPKQLRTTMLQDRLASATSQVKTDQHVKFSVPTRDIKQLDSSKYRDVISSKFVGSSEELNQQQQMKSTTSLGHKWGILKHGTRCSDVEFVPVELLLTGSKINLTLYDKRPSEALPHKHIKVLCNNIYQ